MVYFIFSPDDPRCLVKIGYTKGNVHRRIEILQCGNPFRLVLIMAIEGGMALEQRLHQLFTDARRHGEWFYPTKALQDYIRQCLGEQFNSEVRHVLATPALLAQHVKWLGWPEADVRAGLAGLLRGA